MSHQFPKPRITVKDDSNYSPSYSGLEGTALEGETPFQKGSGWVPTPQRINYSKVCRGKPKARESYINKALKSFWRGCEHVAYNSRRPNPVAVVPVVPRAASSSSESFETRSDDFIDHGIWAEMNIGRDDVGMNKQHAPEETPKDSQYNNNPYSRAARLQRTLSLGGHTEELI